MYRVFAYTLIKKVKNYFVFVFRNLVAVVVGISQFF